MFKIVFISTLSLFALQLLAQDEVRGKQLYESSCRECHGDLAQGREERQTPRMDRQHDWYLEDALRDFKNGEREDIEEKPHGNALSEQDIKDLGAYISGLQKGQ